MINGLTIISMERTEKDSIYFHLENLLVEYLDLDKDSIYPTLLRDLNYLIENNLQNSYDKAYNFLYNLKWFLDTDGKTRPITLIDDILWPIEIDIFDVLSRIYNTYHN